MSSWTKRRQVMQIISGKACAVGVASRDRLAQTRSSVMACAVLAVLVFGKVAAAWNASPADDVDFPSSAWASRMESPWYDSSISLSETAFRSLPCTDATDNVTMIYADLGPPHAMTIEPESFAGQAYALRPAWAEAPADEHVDLYPARFVHDYGDAHHPWSLQVMPTGLMYRSYLAGVKEPRFASVWTRDSQLGHLWDTALGGRLGLLRYGTLDTVFPEGWQIDLEGGSQARLDPYGYSTPLLSVDFRVGVPITFARGRWQFKTGYYHISAHLGDEYLLMNPDARRLNYVRDAIMLGVGCFVTERLRLYAETAYAVGVDDGAEPWEFQFGADWAPARDTGIRGAPFFAVNGHLREEVDFGGNLVVQTGWAWRRLPRGSLFRVGLQYYQGKSEQYEYYDRSEKRFGWGMWADF